MEGQNAEWVAVQAKGFKDMLGLSGQFPVLGCLNGQIKWLFWAPYTHILCSYEKTKG